MVVVECWGFLGVIARASCLMMHYFNTAASDHPARSCGESKGIAIARENMPGSGS